MIVLNYRLVLSIGLLLWVVCYVASSYCWFGCYFVVLLVGSWWFIVGLLQLMLVVWLLRLRSALLLGGF